MQPRRILIVAFDGVQSLDVCGPLEVFTGATRWVEAAASGARPYHVAVATRGAAPVRTGSGLTISGDVDLDSAAGPLDTLVVAGGDGTRAARADAAMIATVRRLAAASRRVTSVCTGAFLLAAAGCLDGRHATTHWASCDALARNHPRVAVDPLPIFVRDGDVLTSAGVTAGIDLALALVEEDLGREAALTVARWLVLFLRRPGNQAQFSAQLSAQLAERSALRDLQRRILDDPGADHRVAVLAERAHLSPRHLARTFTAEVGTTPARYVETVRLEAARRRLEDTAEAVEAVAAACGFGTAETMRRAFLRSLGTGPAEYRRRFRSSLAPTA